MNAAELIKLAPTLILVAFLAMRPTRSRPRSPARPRSEACAGQGARSDAARQLVASDPAGDDGWAASYATRSRSPSSRRRRRSPSPGRIRRARVRPAGRDRPGLTLDATFLQGRDQIAIIDGRIYHKGQQPALTRRRTSRSRRCSSSSSCRRGSSSRGAARTTCSVIPSSSARSRTRSRRPHARPTRRRARPRRARSPCSRSCSTRPWAPWARA